ncbi:MAG: stalk domain-containing protein [Fimbriimonadaceae bacterium]
MSRSTRNRQDRAGHNKYNQPTLRGRISIPAGMAAFPPLHGEQHMNKINIFTRAVKAISLATLAMAAVAASAQTDSRTPVRVVVDGSVMQFPDQQPIRTNGRVLVPLRGIFERLGASVDWNPATQTITARRDGVNVRLAIGQLDASVNNRDVHLDVPATLVGGSTMVPLRFVSEALGADVTWNADMMEVDITQSSGDAILGTSTPARDTYRTAGRPSRRQPVAVSARVIDANTVIPWSLNDRLTSNDAQQGDPFSATLAADGGGDYLGIPAGTKLYGTVGYVRRREGNKPGVIELRFDRMDFPNGQRIPVAGTLIGLDPKSVSRGKNGGIIARSTTRNDRVVFAGAGAGAGLIVGLLSKRPIEDAAIGGLLGFAIGSAQKQQQANDVTLDSGTRFGLRLSNRLVVPENQR